MSALAFLAGCSGPEPVKRKAVDSTVKDSAVHPASLHQPDTVHRAEADSLASTLKENYDQYIAGYTTHCTIDSSFEVADARYKLHVDHICTFDSAIIVPKSYVNSYKLDSFITHDFVTHITLHRNAKKILERTITKKDFWLKYRPELSQYGVIFCPHLEIYLGEMILNYSISIPLTDVGVSATANIDGKGAVTFHVGD